MDIQKLVDGLSGAMRSTRSQYHLTLGQLIKYCAHHDRTALITFGDGSHPGIIESYRGDYADIAIRPNENSITVGEFLERCRKALDSEMTGYKGGEFLMDENTPLWKSDYGEASGIAIIDAQCGVNILLKTKEVD